MTKFYLYIKANVSRTVLHNSKGLPTYLTHNHGASAKVLNFAWYKKKIYIFLKSQHEHLQKNSLFSMYDNMQWERSHDAHTSRVQVVPHLRASRLKFHICNTLMWQMRYMVRKSVPWRNAYHKRSPEDHSSCKRLNVPIYTDFHIKLHALLGNFMKAHLDYSYTTG